MIEILRSAMGIGLVVSGTIITLYGGYLIFDAIHAGIVWARWGTEVYHDPIVLFFSGFMLALGGVLLALVGSERLNE